MEESSTSPAPPQGGQDGQPPEKRDPTTAHTMRTRCEQRLRGAATSADYTISRLDKLLSTTAGQETVLATINYTTHILYYALSSPPSAVLLSKLQPLLRLQPSKSAQRQTPRLLALSALASETRTTLRLFGLISMWKWGSATLKSPPRDPVLRAIAWAQIFSCSMFQLLENVAFLASKGVLNARALDKWGGVGKWYIWSIRAWMAHVMLQFVNLARQRQLSAAAASKTAQSSPSSWRPEKRDESEEESERARAQELRAWKKSLVNNTAWAPLCVHWSFENGIGVPDSLVGLISFTAKAWGLVDMWSATAEAVD